MDDPQHESSTLIDQTEEQDSTEQQPLPGGEQRIDLLFELVHLHLARKPLNFRAITISKADIKSASERRERRNADSLCTSEEFAVERWV